MTGIHEDCRKFAAWLNKQVVSAAKGEGVTQSAVEPEGRFWLGRLETEAKVANSPFGDRSERMSPCAIGIRVRPVGQSPWRLDVSVVAHGWWKDRSTTPSSWRKTPRIEETQAITIPTSGVGTHTFVPATFNSLLANAVNSTDLSVGIRVEVEHGRGGAVELIISVVNESPEDSAVLADTGLYEVGLKISGIKTEPFLLSALPDSFRYDRRIAAYGINCGIEAIADGSIQSTDTVETNRPRPKYWCVESPIPDCSFSTLASKPIPSLETLVYAHAKWGQAEWSSEELDRRSIEESWSQSMRKEADHAAHEFNVESERMATGLRILQSNPMLLRSFMLMNAAMEISSRGRFPGWRPFQLGFILANLRSVLMDASETDTVDILWFATGGGKTETYLGLLVMAALHDRLTGKSCGMTAWSRFPLRLLSLQQTQRFADAIAAAEIIRRREGIAGESFSMGFFVGDSSTPNRIKIDPQPGEPDSLDESMPKRYQVLLRCPFCDHDLRMHFDRTRWRLLHVCDSDACPWPEDGLPVYIVDDEIYRFLPTIVVGTLDKVASISIQAAMRGFVAAPYGLCSVEGHGFAYSQRSDKKTGCLVPGCRGSRLALPMAANRFAPTFRLQDELHLLRDSLGAIDAHYESLLDHLELESSNIRPKIVASSATLTGYERQCKALYQRSGRVFPCQGPRASTTFWSVADEGTLLRKYVALAPRGATLEFAADRLLTTMQQLIRRLRDSPEAVCHEAGIDLANATALVSLFGTNVVYGNTIRDLDASARSLETQVPVQPLVTAQLTGHTPFEEVRDILRRLEHPEAEFNDRIHVVAASSMMSHGVDIDRLNSMVMLGQPLSTAEFMQATARIGRKFPGIVYVLHKMPLERDASLFRAFNSFVEQGDRFVEAVPITRRSRRVLERTLPGLIMARLQHLHEPASNGALTLISKVRQYFASNQIVPETELSSLVQMLTISSDLDLPLREEAQQTLRAFFSRINDPATAERFPNELFPTGVMKSLRDVEEQAPIYD
ncbi:MAG: helicase-related protein [Planctomycetota bacterium]